MAKSQVPRFVNITPPHLVLLTCRGLKTPTYILGQPSGFALAAFFLGQPLELLDRLAPLVY